jgi:hypothetical protein
MGRTCQAHLCCLNVSNDYWLETSVLCRIILPSRLFSTRAAGRIQEWERREERKERAYNGSHSFLTPNCKSDISNESLK